MGDYYPVEGGLLQTNVTFMALAILSQVLGILCIILTGVWLGVYWGGFKWIDPKALFNYHPIFMVLGMVFLYGDAILVYRVFRNYRKLPIKVLHGVLHIMALLFAIIGLRAVFEMHDIQRIPNMYSLHSWLGIIAVVLFCCQWIVGLVTFLFPQISQRQRAQVLPIHVSFGSLLFLLIIGVCVAGITEKNYFSQAYSSFLPREMIGNVLGLCIVLFGAIVFYLVQNPAYRRVEVVSPERQALNQ